MNLRLPFVDEGVDHELHRAPTAVVVRTELAEHVHRRADARHGGGEVEAEAAEWTGRRLELELKVTVPDRARVGHAGAGDDDARRGVGLSARLEAREIAVTSTGRNSTSCRFPSSMMVAGV